MHFWSRFDAIARKHDVLRHPFYVRWSAGELSATELADYSGQYRHAVVALAQATALAAEPLLRLLDRRPQGGGTRGERHVSEILGERIPLRRGRRAAGEFLQRAARNGAQAVGIQVFQRHTDDPVAWNEPGIREAKQSRPQLAARKVARCAHKHHDLWIRRTLACWNL